MSSNIINYGNVILDIVYIQEVLKTNEVAVYIDILRFIHDKEDNVELIVFRIAIGDIDTLTLLYAI